MELYAGTSGYSYKEWKGSFYPEKLPAREMLNYYGTQLPAVEINNTFYRLPRRDTIESWAGQVPEDFRFVVKASRRITHFKRLNNAAEETDYMLRTIATFGDRLGLVLFQLPPNFKKDLPRLESFLDELPKGARAAFEFRHDTWFQDDAYDLLRNHDVALCIADTEERQMEVISTASRGYVRLRRADYTDESLKSWLASIRRQQWQEAYVFFKHEDAGAGPALARRFLELADA